VAALAKTSVTFMNVSCIADDVHRTLDILSNFGFHFHHDVTQDCLHLIYTGEALASRISINVGESATTLRLFLPSLIHFFDHVDIAGEKNLPHRPLQPFFNALSSVHFKRPTELNLPLTASGTIFPGKYTFDKPMSSQFVSGLLFLLPLLDEPSTITLATPPQSRPYIQMTLDVLRTFDITISHNDTYTVFEIPGNQQYTPPKATHIEIEQDYSARAFWHVAQAIKHYDIAIYPPKTHTLQGDSVLSDIITQQQTTIDLTHIPDLAPILALYLSQQRGGTLTNVAILRQKESDRLVAITDFLTKAGISFTHVHNALHIQPGVVRGNVYDTFGDHRIAMMLIIASTVASAPCVLSEIDSIRKSYPSFIAHYESLGGVVYEQ